MLPSCRNFHINKFVHFISECRYSSASCNSNSDLSRVVYSALNPQNDDKISSLLVNNSFHLEKESPNQNLADKSLSLDQYQITATKSLLQIMKEEKNKTKQTFLNKKEIKDLALKQVKTRDSLVNNMKEVILNSREKMNQKIEKLEAQKNFSISKLRESFKAQVKIEKEKIKTILEQNEQKNILKLIRQKENRDLEIERKIHLKMPLIKHPPSHKKLSAQSIFQIEYFKSKKNTAHSKSSSELFKEAIDKWKQTPQLERLHYENLATVENKKRLKAALDWWSTADKKLIELENKRIGNRNLIRKNQGKPIVRLLKNLFVIKKPPSPFNLYVKHLYKSGAVSGKITATIHSIYASWAALSGEEKAHFIRLSKSYDSFNLDP
ncbi:hypothetical protein BB560_000789 [Smittium megazygosporum]|uniref:HMG box domain-containing protein n=1 Tax=Smittium megazygosporum TaxID=133381 RepID=A0A2T9ZJD4_9FUNG|nr:hypothetical protein BB560_000789 [Smittium megazygosporum]